jgi:pimeloyl-ACP methyl ester carboxylesterase
MDISASAQLAPQKITVSFDEHTCTARAVNLANDTLPLLLFVHGAPGSWEAWQKYLKDTALQQRFRMIAIDRMGYGDTLPTKMQPLSVQIAAVEAYIRQYALGKTVTLIGHSVGGAVVVGVAAHAPTAAQRVLLLAPAIAPAYEQPRWYNYIGAWQWVRKRQAAMWRVCNDEMMALPGSLTMIDYTKIQAKIILLHGRLDMIAPYGNARFVQKNINPALLTVYTFPFENHFIPWTKFELIKDLLLKI